MPYSEKFKSENTCGGGITGKELVTKSAKTSSEEKLEDTTKVSANGKGTVQKSPSLQGQRWEISSLFNQNYWLVWALKIVAFYVE